jgi:diaminohydroxyphosphoribosylaminopyrimidine deaminase/5-amino-6-(5-phosphoribosylamino)uracil reductase
MVLLAQLAIARGVRLGLFCCPGRLKLDSEPTVQHSLDAKYMDEALQLGTSALGRTSPNPSVGAVVVNDTRVVGRGWTQPVGQAHAEIEALGEAGERARGAALYVTLEPCCHYGRTPPCVDAIIRAGINRCVVAIQDPFPAVSGEGIARLRAAGLTVDVGLQKFEASELHAGFVFRVRSGRPLVRAKFAMSLDGRIATRMGNSKWITGTVARRHAHVLRDQADAVVVGAGTVRSDDPRLTTRLSDEFAGAGGAHHPLRIVLDGRGVTLPSARIYSKDLPGTTLVVTTPRASRAWLDALASQGVEHLICGQGPNVDLGLVLQILGQRGINEVLVEGGGRVLGSFFDAGLVDRVAAFIAPVVIGGSTAPGPVGGVGAERVAEAWRLGNLRTRVLGEDLLVEGTVVAPMTGTVED